MQFTEFSLSSPNYQREQVQVYQIDYLTRLVVGLLGYIHYISLLHQSSQNEKYTGNIKFLLNPRRS